MNIKMRSTFAGLIYGLVTMFFLSFIISFLGDFAAGGMSYGGASFEGWLWFFATSLFPVSVISGISGYFQAFRNVRLWVYWIICAFLGFIIPLFMGSVGAALMLISEYGFERVMTPSPEITANDIMRDYFKLAPQYALIVLPVTTPFLAFWLKGMQAFLTYVENKS
ncbi:hypothetical protein [Paenibacillus ehimensis]|uniref:hypothetical protein n=1 Tax=Paenibacillus ehimensis TaxID=79264 RepID=UPI0020A6D454|nr:hypothetical protein [Paenibacillus ehimensis]